MLFLEQSSFFFFFISVSVCVCVFFFLVYGTCFAHKHTLKRAVSVRVQLLAFVTRSFRAPSLHLFAQTWRKGYNSKLRTIYRENKKKVHKYPKRGREKDREKFS